MLCNLLNKDPKEMRGIEALLVNRIEDDNVSNVHNKVY